MSQLIDGRNLDWWWITNRYDVPLSGVAHYQGKPFHILERVSEWGNWHKCVLDENGEDDWIDDPDYEDLYRAKRIWFMPYWWVRRWWWLNVRKPRLLRRFSKAGRYSSKPPEID